MAYLGALKESGLKTTDCEARCVFAVVYACEGCSLKLLPEQWLYHINGGLSRQDARNVVMSMCESQWQASTQDRTLRLGMIFWGG